MSGICVVTGVEDASDRVKDMLQRMSQFGQSCAQLSVRPDVACGRTWHGRLASEHAPEISANGLVVLVDGEIFSEEGPVSKPEDTIARLYRSEKLDSLAHLNGSFSAIIVDSKKNLVILATDRLGTRPLFVWHSGRHLSVSSRLSSLLSDNRVGRRMSRQGIVPIAVEGGMRLLDDALLRPEAALVPVHFDLSKIQRVAEDAGTVPSVWKALLKPRLRKVSGASQDAACFLSNSSALSWGRALCPPLSCRLQGDAARVGG